MITVEEAHAGDILRLVRIMDSKLEKGLNRIGLSPGSTFVKFPKQEMERQSVRVRGEKTNVVLGGGMSAKIIVTRADGSKTPLSEMNSKEEGKIEALSGGPRLHETLETLGLKIGDRIKFLRKLPPMEYVAVLDKKTHIHLQEGIASKIWGVTENREIQFTSARVWKEFKVSKLLGGTRAQRYLTSLGIKPGTSLILTGIEEGKRIGYGPKGHLAIETKDGLHIYLGPVEAASIYVDVV
jgi:Fe2+ transport system protein FeoA